MKCWTPEEVEFLKNIWGNRSIDTIAKRLGRTKQAIQMKAKRLGLGDSRISGDKISLNRFCNATKIDHNTIKKRWVKNGFKIYTVMQGKCATRRIDLEEFWKWAEKNKRLINFAKWEEDILGAEPKWAKEKRKLDFLDPSLKNWNRHWTREENALLVQKTKLYRYTYKQLAEEFNRTQTAIKRQLYNLGCKCRPIPLDNHIKWTEDENKKMLELYDKGYTTMVIAKVLDKTQHSIIDRIKKFKSSI